MKLLIVFFVAAVWLQLPTDGVASKIARLDFSQFTNRRSILDSSEESEEGGDETASDAVKSVLTEMFTDSSWRELIIYIASPETMANPKFREKWSVTAADDQEKEEGDDDEELSPETLEKVKSFLESNRWKALFALSSSKSELLNPAYREEWELGDLPTEEIAAADQDGDFFQGPQWVAWLDLTSTDIDKDMNDWIKAKILLMWIMDIGNELMAMDEEEREID